MAVYQRRRAVSILSLEAWPDSHEIRVVTSPPANRKTHRAGKILLIVSIKCANLTVYINRDNNKFMLDLLFKIPLCS
jgi:hypothetical protein